MIKRNGKEGGGRWEADFHVCMLEAQCRRLLLKVGLSTGDVVARNGTEMQRSELESLQSLSWESELRCPSCEGLICMFLELDGPKLNLVEDEEQEFVPQTGA